MPLGISLWEEEIPSKNEMQYGIENLQKVNNKVDFILAHTLPKAMIKNLMAHYHIPIEEIDNQAIYLTRIDDVAKNLYNRYMDPTANYLQEICNKITFSKYFCGHFHENLIIGNFIHIHRRTNS